MSRNACRLARVFVLLAVVVVVMATASAPWSTVAYADETVTIPNVEISNVTSTNAFLKATAYKDRSVDVDVCGIYLGTSEAGMVKRNTEAVPDSSNGYGNLNIWYDLTDELHITLLPDTTYYVKFYCMVGSEEFASDTVAFTTLADVAVGSAAKGHIEQQQELIRQVNEAVAKFKDAHGTVQPSDANGYLDAAYACLSSRSSDEITSVGKNDSCVWAEFKDGALLACAPAVDGVNSVPADSVCSIQTYEPCNDTFTNIADYIRMIDEAADSLAGVSSYWHRDVIKRNSEVTISALKQLGLRGGNEVILWNGHGNYADEFGEFLAIGERYDANRRMRDADYNNEFVKGNLVILESGGIGITSKFVESYMRDLDDALVFLGACESAHDSTMADAWMKSGAATVVGFTKTVRTSYDCLIIRDFVKALCSKDDTGRYMTASAALDEAKAANGATDAVKHGGEGAAPKLFGDGGFRFGESLDDVYGAYLDKVWELQSRYGDHSVKDISIGGGPMDVVAGVGYVDLVDFDADGTEELVVAYGDESKFDSSDIPYDAFTLEVWGYESGKVKLLHSMGPHRGDESSVAEMPDGVYFDISVAKKEGTASYVRSVKGATETFSTLKGGSFVVSDTFRIAWSGEAAQYYVNGSKVAESDYYQAEDRYLTSAFDQRPIVLGNIPWNDDPYDYERELFIGTDEVIARLMIGTTDAADEDYRENNGYYEKEEVKVVRPDATGSDGYILPLADSYRYTADDLALLSDWELFIARNEIPARHGRIFKDADLVKYFEAKSWYNGTLTGEKFVKIKGLLNSTEEANVETILSIEEKRGSKYKPEA